jgi:hypothetical protein
MTMERDDRAALERLRDILDAYGGDPERWPDAERRAALDLLARSAEARRLCDEALRLDAALDLLPAAQPSPGLEERVIAAAQRAAQDAVRRTPVVSLAEARGRRDASGPPRRGLLLAALPLAAAAALALYVARTERTEPSQVAKGGHPAASAAAGGDAASAPREASEAELVAALGSYRAPNDGLSELAGGGYDADPWRSCSEGDLGCVKSDTLPFEPVSRGANDEVRILS